MGIIFLRPTAPGTGPRPSAPFTFLRTPAQITCSRPPSIKNYLFTDPSNKSLPCLFTPLNKTQPTAYSKIPLRKKSYHT